MSDAAVPASRVSIWPIVLGGLSIVYALLAVLHAILQFTVAAFGPVIPGVGSDRPPIAPVELRWHAALEAIFCFSFGIMLACAASLVLRRKRQGALMLGLWAVSSIAVHLIFLGWSVSLDGVRERYFAMAAEWKQQAIEGGLQDARPFYRYERIIDVASQASNAALAIPFIFPVAVGLVMITPSVRREISEWN